MNDQELITLIEDFKAGDERAYEEILGACEYIIRRILRDSHVWGYEPDDLRQELAIRLIRIVKNYDKTKCKSNPFGYIALGLRSTIPDLISKAYTNNRKVDRDAILATDMEVLIYNGEEATDNVMDVINKNYVMPVIRPKEEKQQLFQRLRDNLSELEFNCLRLKAFENMSYKEIAALYNTDAKAVDNAINRARNVIKGLIKNGRAKSIFIDEQETLNKYLSDYEKKKEQTKKNRNKEKGKS